MTRVLVVCYGNVLRGDDGVGWHAADRLREGLLPEGAEVRSLHQLTPELAEDLARADLAVFVDAAAEGAPGEVTTARLEPDRGPAAWSHHLGPAALLGLAERLYGPAPEAWVVSVAVADTDAGEELSAPIAEALPIAVGATLGIVEGRSGISRVRPT